MPGLIERSSDISAALADLDDGQPWPAERRGQLMRTMASFFVMLDDNRAAALTAEFDNVLLKLADLVEPDARAFTAQTLSAMVQAPHGIITKLAHDEIDIARSVLRHSPVLTPADLAKVALHAGLQHMGEIATRSELPVTVTDVLVMRGSDDVRRIVAANHGADFSDKAFSRLSVQARADVMMQGALADRHDLPDMVIEFLVRVAPERIRVRLRKSGRIDDVAKVESACRQVATQFANGMWLNSYDFEAASAEVAILLTQRRADEQLLRELADGDRFAAMALLFALIADIDPEQAKDCLVRLDTTAFIVAAKAAGLGLATVNAMLRAGPWRHRLDAGQRQKALRSFQSLSPDEARGAFEALRGQAA